MSFLCFYRVSRDSNQCYPPMMHSADWISARACLDCLQGHTEIVRADQPHFLDDSSNALHSTRSEIPVFILICRQVAFFVLRVLCWIDVED